MSGRRHKKLNLQIEFSNSLFIKFCFKHIGVKLAFKINLLIRFFVFQAIYLSSRCKKTKHFQGVYPPPPESPPGLGHELVAELISPQVPTCILQHSKLNLFSKMNIIKTACINACMPLIFFYNRWKHQKTRGWC